MRIVYMGTPEFAALPLKMLYEEGYEIPLVVTQPDKARDRGKKVQPTAVKSLAEELGLTVAQPDTLRNNEAFLEQVRALAPDMIVVAAYGKLLPPALLEIPPLGCVNIHGSLLPKYRGAAPIQRCLLDGCPVTGVTLMYMSQGMDEGDMIAARETDTAGKTAGELHDELSCIGGRLLIDMLPALAAGTAPRTPQNNDEASFAPMITKAEGHIDFRQSAGEIECRIRAFQPWPGAYGIYREQPLKLLAAQVSEFTDGKTPPPAPGTILAANPTGIHVATGSGILVVTRIQAPGKRAVEVSEYLKGNKIEIGAAMV